MMAPVLGAIIFLYLSDVKYDVFISYSRKDTKAADKVCEALNAAGLSCFIDREGIDGGANFPKVLANAIDDSGVFLLLAGKNAYDSRFTQAEILHAFKHKRSGCIIPYLLDDSKMPSDLEFLLGNVNWVDSAVHPVQDLPDIVKKALANPDQGTIGGRKVRRKWYVWLLIPLFIAIVSLIAILVGNDMKQKAAEKAALAHRAAFQACLERVDSLTSAAAAMGRSEQAIETTSQQIAFLKAAEAGLHSADSLRSLHTVDGYIGLFSDTGKRSAAVRSALDSMYNAWNEYAMESYRLWRVTGSNSEAENALDCINHALSVKPDSGLESIKQELTK